VGGKGRRGGEGDVVDGEGGMGMSIPKIKPAPSKRLHCPRLSPRIPILQPSAPLTARTSAGRLSEAE